MGPQISQHLQAYIQLLNILYNHSSPFRTSLLTELTLDWLDRWSQTFIHICGIQKRQLWSYRLQVYIYPKPYIHICVATPLNLHSLPTAFIPCLLVTHVTQLWLIMGFVSVEKLCTFARMHMHMSLTLEGLARHHIITISVVAYCGTICIRLRLYVSSKCSRYRYLLLHLHVLLPLRSLLADLHPSGCLTGEATFLNPLVSPHYWSILDWPGPDACLTGCRSMVWGSA